LLYLLFFFCQAEDGIRYSSVTGVQTCALPISITSWTSFSRLHLQRALAAAMRFLERQFKFRFDILPASTAATARACRTPGAAKQIGRASWRQRAKQPEHTPTVKKRKQCQERAE